MTTKPDRVKTSVGTRSAAALSLLAGKSLPALRRALLRWYDEHRRDLPWRKTRDPYRIWLSEVMLQQTRVAAVFDHYRIFLERFPDIATLAAASEDAVLAAWSGLGYYRRARMLHKCAKEIASARPSGFPQSAQELQALPGIGRYTAAAIASIAFNEPVAVVDGNVERVLQRLTGIALSAAQNWQQAQSLLTPSRPGDSNQALMELGATVCVPREPRCPACPVRKWCATRGEHPRAQRPPRLKKAQVWCSVDRSSYGNGGAKADKIRLIQRPKHLSLMAGMWELPQSSEPPQPLPDSARWRTFRHSITVTEYTVHVLRNTRLPGGSSSSLAKGKWIAIDRVPLLPLTGLTRKILKADSII